MDQQDKDCAALNIKFEYERAKKLRAAELQLLNAPHALNDNPHDLRFYDDAAMRWGEPIEPQPEFDFERAIARIQRKEIIKLALKLTFRIVLVIAVAVTVLAVIS